MLGLMMTITMMRMMMMMAYHVPGLRISTLDATSNWFLSIIIIVLLFSTFCGRKLRLKISLLGGRTPILVCLISKFSYSLSHTDS